MEGIGIVIAGIGLGILILGSIINYSIRLSDKAREKKREQIRAKSRERRLLDEKNNVARYSDTSRICPHCKNPNKRLYECEWCGNKTC